MDLGGTIPWMESVESCLERRSRAKHDSRDGGGRNASGTAFEEPESKRESSEIKCAVGASINDPILPSLREGDTGLRYAPPE
jgi:hypothetical protein